MFKNLGIQIILIYGELVYLKSSVFSSSWVGSSQSELWLVISELQRYWKGENWIQKNLIFYYAEFCTVLQFKICIAELLEFVLGLLIRSLIIIRVPLPYHPRISVIRLNHRVILNYGKSRVKIADHNSSHFV